MDGPVAVCENRLQMPDGSIEEDGLIFLVQRHGRWYLVVDMFQHGDLTQEELDVIDRHTRSEDQQQT
jgi:hypothetical protein